MDRHSLWQEQVSIRSRRVHSPLRREWGPMARRATRPDVKLSCVSFREWLRSLSAPPGSYTPRANRGPISADAQFVGGHPWQPSPGWLSQSIQRRTKSANAKSREPPNLYSREAEVNPPVRQQSAGLRLRQHPHVLPHFANLRKSPGHAAHDERSDILVRSVVAMTADLVQYPGTHASVR